MALCDATGAPNLFLTVTMNSALAMELGDSIPQYNRSREPAKDLAAGTFQQTVRGLDKNLHKILGLEIVSRS
ncbi:hypothetical protein DAPK24_039190 [Pichia kluyveri]|uniref:Uncharacterized protein n=1 Tax=Pichia kluyveri TaxID=36015 RepID=A0AAV5R9P8_PICKL|nr:hypothetical protein DAPK24_039190 [Pichia kluyveri]